MIRITGQLICAVLMLVMVFGIAVFADDTSTQRSLRKEAAHRQRRIIFNNDGGDVLVHAKEKDVEKLLACRTTGLVGSHCDSLFYSTSRGSFGSFSHPTKVGDTFTSTESRYKDNLLQWLLDQGTDPIKLMTGFGHEHDMEVFWSMRINDTHDSWGYEWADIITSSIKKEHPEWLVASKKKRSKVGGYLAADFSHLEIRDYTFRFVEEVCQNYDVDGVEIDFLRHPVYFKRHAWGKDVGDEERAMMTELMQRIRAMADKQGEERGRPLLIAVRVPDSVDWCNAIGIDIVNWLENDLLDIMNITGYFRLNPWETSVELGHKYGVPVYACLSETRMKEKEAKSVRSSIEGYRGRAMNAWAAGVDGIYLFNAFNPDHPLWRELGDPESLAKRTKVYTTGGRGVNVVRSWLVGGERFLNRNPVSPERPRKITSGEPEKIEIQVGENPEETGAVVTLGLRFKEEVGKNLVVQVNGEKLKEPVQNEIWYEYAVPVALIRCDKNEVTLVSEENIILEDLVIWMRHT